MRVVNGRPARAGILHESTRTRVTRAYLAGRTVVYKEPLGRDRKWRRRHEVAILERLRGVDGVAQLVDAPGYPGSIVLADAGEITLSELAKPLAVDELLHVAAGLAQAVAGMHGRGVLHRDISPANCVLSRDGVPCLVDYALATLFAESRPEFTHHSEIVGSLAYLAPEQTGRTGRPVDQRADLYALGATLYELATGEPPFGTGDPLRLTHDHLARVPVPPAMVNPRLPEVLSEIIMRLLAKEPDHRYQTAEGLAHDLAQVRDAQADPAAAPVRIGQHDVPLRLLPPSRLVGRGAGVGALEAAVEAALTGRCQAVLVSGTPGVGKTVLVDQLRPMVTSRNGWFVAGKFDQYRQDLEYNAGHQVFRALGRLLLAEPEDELAKLRARIVETVGPNAGLLSAVVPEFAALLGVPPEAGDSLTAQARTQRAAVQVLRAVATRERPVVMFLDDLQWGGRTPLGFVDVVLSEEPVEGLLLVGAFRDTKVDPGPLLAALLSRWRGNPRVRWLRLDELSEPDLVTMVAEMLHVDRAAATGLVEVIEPHTSGNPYETMELLTALRREGVLTATAAGWRWDGAAVEAHLSGSEVSGLVAARVAAMPAVSRALVEAMACLGGRAETTVLQTAAAAPPEAMDERLAPALDEGILVVERGRRPEAVRFRHDRIREVVLAGLDPSRLAALRLAVARRLAAVPELYAAAAEQYLPVVDEVDDPQERRQVVRLLQRAAERATLSGDYALVNGLLTAALGLIDPGETATLIEARTGRHAALFSLGCLDEADDDYRIIARLCPSAPQRVGATSLQVRSLTFRTLFAEAVALGLEALRECGITVPPADRLDAELDHHFGYLYHWLDHTDTAEDLARPELTDPTLLAAARLIHAVVTPAYHLLDHHLMAWLSLEAVRIWLEHGPSRALLTPVSHVCVPAEALRGDYTAGPRADRRLVALGEARGYEPETSQAREQLAVQGWPLEPIETIVEEAVAAREGLLAGGDLAYAGYTYVSSVTGLLECAASLDDYLAEVDTGLAFVRRTGSEQIGQWLDSYRWLAGVLRGENSDTASEAASVDPALNNPLALAIRHTTRAMAAAIFGDQAGLVRHTAATMPLLNAITGVYPSSTARLLRGLALAGQARASHGAERAALLTELDEVTSWLAARAREGPENFLHLLLLLEGERAWAVGDVLAAEVALDAARREAAARSRPWHRALITERAARMLLARGLDHAGGQLLAEARRYYAAWGASAKVDQLDWAYPTLRPPAGPGAPPVDVPAAVSTGTLDLLGILSASQALSSETTIDRLHSRVVEVLSAMTGATTVQLVPWNSQRQDWVLPIADDRTTKIDDADTAGEKVVPLSVLRYVQRTGEPLVVADAAGDDRFARDPYFAGLDRCSLLGVPIFTRGSLRAVLVLENRLIRAAFTAARLDAVRLIAGQLAVSLDNAQLYAELTTSRARIVTTADQTRRRIVRDLHDGAQQRLVFLAFQANAARAAAPPEAADLVAQLDELAAEVTGALDELRELARGIHPAILTEGGLRPALKSLARRSTVPVELDVRTDERLPEEIEITAYYIVAEALTNTAKHAHASVVTVSVEAADAVLRVRVRDDGRGGAELARGSGLVGLKDRAEALGGRLSVRSVPGAGTTVHAELPLDPARDPG